MQHDRRESYCTVKCRISEFTNNIAQVSIINIKNSYVKTEHFTLYVKDNDRTKTANIQIVVLQPWRIFTRTRNIAMFYLKFKIVRTCDFCDRNPLKGFKINSRQVMKEITCKDNFTTYIWPLDDSNTTKSGLVGLNLQVNDTSEVSGDPEHTQEGYFDGETITYNIILSIHLWYFSTSRLSPVAVIVLKECKKKPTHIIIQRTIHCEDSSEYFAFCN